MLSGEFGLDLLVVDDPSTPGIDEEHLPGLESALRDHLGRVDIDHTHFGGHDDQIVVGDPVAARPKTVAVEHRADHLAIGEGDTRWPIPRLHER